MSRPATGIDDRPPQAARPGGHKVLIEFVRLGDRSEQRRIFLGPGGIRISNHIPSHGNESRRALDDRARGEVAQSD